MEYILKDKQIIPQEGVKLVNIDKSMEKSSWESFQEAIRGEPFALCHGDFHASNFLVDAETMKIDGLDWTQVSDILLNYLQDQILAFVEAHGDYEYYVMKTVV